jgi:hypothetical protein
MDELVFQKPSGIGNVINEVVLESQLRTLCFDGIRGMKSGS